MNQATRGQNVAVTWSEIDAPLFRPVVLRDVKLRSQPGTSTTLALDLTRVELDLRLAALFDPTRGRPLRQLKLEGILGEIRQLATGNSPAHFDLSSARRLIADNFSLTVQNLRIARGDVALDLHDAALTASELEAGHFTAGDIVVNTPWFRKSFSDLKGSTSWQYDRLSIGAVSLLRGLDLDAITFDLAHIAQERIGIEATFDAFGGKLRASIATEPSDWELAATATQVSLAQASDALDFFSRASGTLRSSKFTFRGALGDFANATASIWAELDGFTWRDRTAETIMLGASLFSRQIQIEQIYVKQRENQFTLSGELTFPRKRSDWPDFRGDVSASVKDLGEFARLFGGRASEFSGELEVNGSVSEREHKFGGQLIASGNSLTILGAPVDSLIGKFSLEGAAVVIEQCELRRQRDFATASGTMDLAVGHRYAGKIAVSIADLAPYETFLIWAGDYFEPEGSVSITGEADVASPTGAGTFRVQAHSLRPKTSFALLPFDAELEGTYSAEKIFFQKFSLRNAHAALNTFATIAEDYLQLQFLRFEVNSRSVFEGNVYLPVTTSMPAENGHWLTGIVPDSAYDVDLRFLAADLGNVASALSTRRDFAGKLEGQLQIYGTTEEPEAHLTVHARDALLGGVGRLSADIDGSTAANTMLLKANLAGAGFAPAQAECSLPYEYDENGGEYRLRSDAPFTAALNIPGIPIGKLPGSLTGDFLDGSVRAKLVASGSWQHPAIEGDAQLENIRSHNGRTISARLAFKGATAKINDANLAENGVNTSFSGDADFADTTAFKLRLRSVSRLRFDHSSASTRCLQDIHLASDENPTVEADRTDLAQFRGPLFAEGWSLTLSDSSDPAASERTFAFCSDNSDGETLMLHLAP